VREAERLFDEGKARYEAGQIEQACELLGRSNRLDPAVGTLGLLGACHERQGKIATAWEEYRETAERARAIGDAEREQYARDRALALEAKIPTITLVAPSDVTVSRNGAPVAPHQSSAYAALASWIDCWKPATHSTTGFTR
jgi:hypothetical protein